MKQWFVAFLLMALAAVCKAQDTERKVRFARNGDKETYYVLKSDNNVLHGSYEKKGSFSRVEGFYKNGLKDGMWTEYSTGSKLRSRGAYLNDERIGLWKFYNWEGELEQEYNFSTKELLFDHLLEGMKERRYRVINGADTVSSFLERPPLYIGGKTKMQSALTKGSMIGIILRLTRASGNVVIAFTIDSAGRARDYRVTKGIHEACDAEALRMVKQLPHNWLPAMLNGQVVEVEHTIAIAFKNDM